MEPRGLLRLSGMRLAAVTLVVAASSEICHASDLPFPRLDVTGAAAVHADDADSQFALAQRLEHGEGVARDYGAAIALYCKAAEQGHGGAAHSLGWIHLNGRGVAQSDDRAASWFKIAAERGSAVSANLLRRLPSADTDDELGCPQPDRPSGSWHRQSVEKLDRLVPQDIKALAGRWAQEFALDPYLVLAVITVESAFDDNAVSPKLAQGLMQLIPETAKRFGVSNAFDPSENVRGGSQYLRWLLDHFDGDLKLALAGYNAGEGAVATHGGVPPFAETIGYLEKIGQIYAHPDLREPDPRPPVDTDDDLNALVVSLRGLSYLRSD